MPLAWKIDPADQLIVAVGKGDVTRADVDRLLDAMVEGRALGFRKLCDVYEGDTSMTAADVLPLATRMRSLHELGVMGALAIVFPPGHEKIPILERALGALAAAKRPMRLFEDRVRAYSWISKQGLGDDGRDIDLQSRADARAFAGRIRRLVRTVEAEARST